MSLGRSISWIGASQFASFCLQLGAAIVLSRILTPQEMGIYALALATLGLFMLVQALGLRALIIREETLSSHLATTAFSVNLVMALVISALVALSSLAGGVVFHNADVRHALLALALTPLINTLEFLPSAQLERAGRFKALALTAIGGSITGALTTIACALLGASFMSAAYAGWVSAAASALLANVFGREFTAFRFGFREWRRVADFGLQMLITSGLHTVGDRITDLLLARFLGIPQLGIYSRASGLNSQLWNNIHLAAGRALFVDFARLNREGVSLRPRYMATVEIITATLWPAFAGFAIVSGPLIQTFYGERWLAAAQPLTLLAIASMVLVSITMTWEVFSATGNLRTQTRIEALNAGFSILAFAMACPFGLRAAAASRIVAAIFATLLYRPHLNRMTGTSLSMLLPIYARSGMLTVAAVAPTLLVMLNTGMSAATPISHVLSAVACGVCLWATALLLTKHPVAVLIVTLADRTPLGRLRWFRRPQLHDRARNSA